jgi:hypothetical protein
MVPTKGWTARQAIIVTRCRDGTRFASGEAMTTTIVVQNPYSRKLERYDIGGLTPEELQALPLDERICEEISAAIAPCPPEEFLAAYVVRVGVVDAGQQITGRWIANRIRALFVSVASARSAVPGHNTE